MDAETARIQSDIAVDFFKDKLVKNGLFSAIFDELSDATAKGCYQAEYDLEGLNQGEVNAVWRELKGKGYSVKWKGLAYSRKITINWM